MGHEAELADELAALAERMDMAVDGFDVFEMGAFDAEQIEMDRQEIFADDIEPGGRQQMMDVGDAAGDRIFDRDHGELRRAVRDGRERVFESGAGQGLQFGKDIAAGDVGIGARLALIGDLRSFHFGLKSVRARSRSAGVSTPKAASSTRATSMRMPASRARNCSSFSRRSKAEGGNATKRSSAPRL